ncbi:MAG: hypothetical protein L0323_03445 [Planctomycetes bacterium]|nr:hypothetical protein [Planctomycetota bacterium]
MPTLWKTGGQRAAGSVAAAFLSLSLAGCATPKGETTEDKRAYVRRMRDEALADLYRAKPEVRARLEKAAGYGVFSDISVKILLVGSGHGYGVVVDNKTGKETYMRMGQVGVGYGIGVKDFRAVFVFKDKGMLDSFVEKGWDFGGSADATATTGDTGGSAGGQTSVGASGAAAGGGGAVGAGGKAGESLGGPLEVYVFTKSGISLQAMVAGTKYWKDGELNTP